MSDSGSLGSLVNLRVIYLHMNIFKTIWLIFNQRYSNLFFQNNPALNYAEIGSQDSPHARSAIYVRTNTISSELDHSIVAPLQSNESDDNNNYSTSDDDDDDFMHHGEKSAQRVVVG